MIKHILKITETDDITARMAIRNGKGRPEKKKSGKRMHRKSIYNPKMFNYPLTSQISNIVINIYKKDKL